MSIPRQYFNQLLSDCIKQVISDIYLIPRGNENYQIMIKNAINTQIYSTLDKANATQLITYIKYLANLDITEKRRPQTGQFELTEFPKIFIRVASAGDFRNQETLVCRLIYETSMTAQNFIFPEQFRNLKSIVSKPGLHLLAGSMGSGKTTSAFGVADSLADHGKIVLTIEDPVEIKNEKFIQLQVNSVAQMDYSDLIKSGLRQRPDVFLIGEIRDTKTAIATVNAALSGHTVISTIHAQSAYRVIPRLLELGIEKSYLVNALSSITFQKLLMCCDGNIRAIQHQVVGNELWEINEENWYEIITRAYQTKKISNEIWQKNK